MLRLSLCDYSDAYILVKGTLTAAAPNNVNEMVIFKNCVPFTNCISRINNTQVDDAHDIDVAMSMYNLTEYSDIYSKTSGILWQYCIDETMTALHDDGAIVDFTADNATTDSFKIKKNKKWNRRRWPEKC